MASNKIQIGDSYKFEQTIESMLQDYEKDITLITQKAVEDVSKEAVQKLKKNSPRGRTGQYGRSWALQKGKNYKRVVFESTVYSKVPGLPHLLEKKHRIVDRNNKTHGYSEPKVHIQPVDDWAATELMRRITTKI